jgi:alpha-glucan, water dikinase
MHSDIRGNKDLLYLDLALEGVIRGAIERGVGSLGLGAAAFVSHLLQNLVLTAGDNEELCYCLKAWLALPASVQHGNIDDPLRALQATAVVDRVRRALGVLSVATSERVSPAARSIGDSAGIGTWAVDLFAEEVVRGGPAFGVSLVLSTVEPALRRCAELGSWQIISPASVTGAAQGCTCWGVSLLLVGSHLQPNCPGQRVIVGVSARRAQP